MTKSQEYWASLPQHVKDARKAKMRQYSANNYLRLKSSGVIKLKGRRTSIYGHKGKDYFIYEYIVQHKLALGECSDCGLLCEEWNHVMFAFDHLNPSDKLFSISKARLHNISIQMLDDEMNKCELVCHNCHAFRTWVHRDHDLNKRFEQELPLLELMNEQ